MREVLSKAEIESNKQEFISLLRSIDNRKNSDIEGLISFLNNSDFFTAPASQQYNNNFPGGLCQHSLNVYYNLINLVIHTEKITDPICFEEDSLKIVALLHDISKINTYETYVKNSKVYCANGKNHDEIGNYNWEATLEYKIKDVKNRFVYGSHESTSEYMIRHYIPLNVDESTAILHHTGSMAWDSAKDNISEIYNNYQLALLLHQADMLATFIWERVDHE